MLRNAPKWENHSVKHLDYSLALRWAVWRAQGTVLLLENHSGGDSGHLLGANLVQQKALLKAHMKVDSLV